MESLAFVERDPGTGVYRPGLQLVTLAGIVLNQMPLRSEGMVELSAVAAETGLATNLAILRDDALFYLASVEGPRAPKLFTMMGRQGPLHSTGMGKILLAHLPADEREAALARIPYPRYTPHTAASAEELRPMLDEALGRGYAIEREELAFGRACVASPVRDARGRIVAATSISGPLSELDLDSRQLELASRVIEMADRISRRLGWVAMPTGPGRAPLQAPRQPATIPGGDGQP
jgi:DNA-binding IclR family transcriptional regulator